MREKFISALESNDLDEMRKYQKEIYTTIAQ